MNQYKYALISAEFLFDGESKPYSIEPGFVSDLYLERDYDNDHYPIFKFPVNVTTKTYHKILTNKTKTKIRVRMQVFKYDEEKITSKKDIINDVFIFFLDEETPFLDKDIYDKATANTEDGGSHQDYKHKLELYLFKEKDISKSGTIINKIYSSTNVSNMIAHCLTKIGARNVLFRKPDNTKGYTQYVIPPLSFNSAMKYMEQHIGIYNKGAVVFFDIDRTYIMDKGSDCSVWALQENKKTLMNVPKSLNGTSFFLLCEDDSKNKQFIVTVDPNQVQIINSSITADQTHGNRQLIVNSRSGDVSKTDSTGSQHGSGNYSVVSVNSDNGYVASMMKHSVYEKSKMIIVTIGDFDINAITPNKEFVFKFEDPSINSSNGGKYRLASSKTVFKKEGKEYSISTELTFLRG